MGLYKNELIVQVLLNNKGTNLLDLDICIISVKPMPTTHKSIIICILTSD